MRTSLKRVLKWLPLLLVLFLILTAADGCSTEPTALTKAANDKLAQANKLHEHYQLKPMDTSIELDNIINRIYVTNNPNQVGWIYLFANDGSVIARMPVRGKVTSGNKRLSRKESYQCVPDSNSVDHCGIYELPDEMGAYGDSNPYVFWFSPNGMLSQYPGMYYYSSEPYKLNPQTKTLEYTVDAEEMAKVAEYKKIIQATPLEKAKGGQ